MVNSGCRSVTVRAEPLRRSTNLAPREQSIVPRRPRPIRAWQLPEPAPVPTGQAALLDAQLDRHLVRQLGAVPLLMPLIEQLKLREVVNARCHPQGTASRDLDLGRVVELIVFNRLLAPRPLVHVETWLADTVLPDL